MSTGKKFFFIGGGGGGKRDLEGVYKKAFRDLVLDFPVKP